MFCSRVQDRGLVAKRPLAYGMMHGYHLWSTHESYLIWYQVLRMGEFWTSSIHSQEHAWDLNLAHGLLSPDEAALVLNIPLSHTPVEDKIIWPFTPSRKYTVSSGSKFLTKLNSVQIPTADQQWQSGIWNQIWGLNVPNKVWHFMWRVCKEAIPAKHNLLRRKILLEDKCK